mgnify:CR=1 FL=1
MFDDIPIKFFKGTHRVKDPKETIEINEKKLRTAGITRLTDITDLDRVKIPVFSAIRPTAQSGSVSVYAGKGATREQAKASARSLPLSRAELIPSNELELINPAASPIRYIPSLPTHKSRMCLGLHTRHASVLSGAPRSFPSIS